MIPACSLASPVPVNAHKPTFPARNALWRRSRALALLAVSLIASAFTGDAKAATVWAGPRITFTKADNTDHTQAANQDRITANVWLTRGASHGVFNIAKETAYAVNSSPVDTEWATGSAANHASLTFTSWEAWARSVGNPPATVGIDAVLHLKTDDIYIDIRFTSWSQRLGGGFSYERSTPSSLPNTPPLVSIDSPTNGTAVTTPANITIAASATDPDAGDSVAQVQFFNGTTSLGSDTASPFSVTASFFPGVHSLVAVATDTHGLSATSSIISLTVTSTPIANPIAARIPKGDITVELQPVADGMNSPLGMAVPDDGTGRMFVYDQNGVVWLVSPGGRSPIPVLDVRTRLSNISGSYDERGLLGLAVHPNFAQFPLLYTYTSEPNAGPADFPTTLPAGATNNHQSVIAEWRLDATVTNRVDPGTRREILRIDQPQSNHNGGTMRFGPDGLLYVSLGDGGQADDQGNGHPVPTGNGQDTNTILGSVIRIDINGTSSANGQYAVPQDNPFVGGPGVDEIYAYGLRNPFSFHFDSGTGTLYLGDVGQNKIEEINIIQKGGNYGWNIKEGTFFFDPDGNRSGFVTAAPVRPVPPDLIDPIAEYDHDDGTAVIGGTVYRGSRLPALAGRYVFGDWGVFGSPSGRLYYLDGSTVRELRIGLEDRPLGLYLKGFGEDAAGELYVFGSKPQGPTGVGGVMLKLVPPPAAPLEITSASVTNGTNFSLEWTGGRGPVGIQRQISVSEPVMMNALFTTGTTAVLPQRNASGIFRGIDTARQPAVPFTAALSGAMERPATTTAGTGSGLFRLEGNTLIFSIVYQGLTGPAISAHIHGATNTTGSTGVLLDLEPYNGGAFGSSGTLAGTAVLTDAQKAALLSSRTYVNIHTDANRSGEIRGQIAPVLMESSLAPAYEPAPVTSPASGFGTFTLVGTQLTFNVTYQGLTSAASMAHIHGPGDFGQSVGVLIDLAPYNGGAYGTSGTISGTVGLNPAQLAAVIDGRTYVNFHTAAYSQGELRGQIVPQSTGIPLTSWITGLNERPTQVTNNASGLGLFALHENKLAFNIVYTGLSGPAIMAHIHGASPTTNFTGVQIDLAPFNGGAFGASGSLSGTVQLSAAQRTMIAGGQAYVNIHTDANPGGEVRGQIASVMMFAGADGNAERPAAVATSGSALGLFALVGNRLDLNITYRNLSGPATMAHIHAPAGPNANAPFVLDFSPQFNGGSYGASGSVHGSTALSETVLNHLIDSLGYINFHTTINGGGEVRGQIVR